MDDLRDRFGKPALSLGAGMDTRKKAIRTRETRMGNLMADLARSYYGSDIGFLYSGNFRAYTVFKKGPQPLSIIYVLVPLITYVY